jgi:hypothetical protein
MHIFWVKVQDAAKRAFRSLVGFGAALQVTAYLLGVYDQVYQWLVDNRALTVSGIIFYFFCWLGFFSTRHTQDKVEYNDDLREMRRRTKTIRSKNCQNQKY